ncbi:MAG TPA: response regulator [Kofleriaceae bacterium]|nr:response regulator [Kofleriaceae bacterium]
MSKVAQLQGQFLARFCETARARLARSLELLGAGASTHAGAIRIELYSLAGEAAFLGCTDVLALARQGEAAARRIPEDRTAVLACTRAVRALGRALDALEALPLGGPRVQDAAAFSAARPPRAAAFRGRILLVDDSKLSSDLLTSMLVEEGYAVETASTAPGLERVLAKFSPDLALSDVNMPELDCAVVCRRVREVAPRARVVLISGLAEEALARARVRVGADGHVTRERGLAAVVERVRAEFAAAAEPRGGGADGG